MFIVNIHQNVVDECLLAFAIKTSIELANSYASLPAFSYILVGNYEYSDHLVLGHPFFT